MANDQREPFVLDFPNGQRVEDILKKADAINAEVAQARVGYDGTRYNTLKERIDAVETTASGNDLGLVVRNGMLCAKYESEV